VVGFFPGSMTLILLSVLASVIFFRVIFPLGLSPASQGGACSWAIRRRFREGSRRTSALASRRFRVAAISFPASGALPI
jgi:hypothetical protein